MAARAALPTLPLAQLTHQTGLGDFPAVQRRTCGCKKVNEERNMSQQPEDTGMQPSSPVPVPGATGQSAAVEQTVISNKVAKRKSRIKKEASWPMLTEVVKLMQMLVMATALVLYYIIYCYMQLVYYTLRSVVYFHNADGPMKLTIAIVAVTTVIISFNFLRKIEKLIGLH